MFLIMIHPCNAGRTASISYKIPTKNLYSVHYGITSRMNDLVCSRSHKIAAAHQEMALFLTSAIIKLASVCLP